MVYKGQLDALIFFVAPLSPMPHDVDVKALSREATVYDPPKACSPATSDLIVCGDARLHQTNRAKPPGVVKPHWLGLAGNRQAVA